MSGIFGGGDNGAADRARQQAQQAQDEYNKQKAISDQKEKDLQAQADAQKKLQAEKQAKATALSFGISPFAQQNNNSSLLG